LLDFYPDLAGKVPCHGCASRAPRKGRTFGERPSAGLQPEDLGVSQMRDPPVVRKRSSSNLVKGSNAKASSIDMFCHTKVVTRCHSK